MAIIVTYRKQAIFCINCSELPRKTSGTLCAALSLVSLFSCLFSFVPFLLHYQYALFSRI